MPAGRGIASELTLRFFDELPTGFDPIVRRIAWEREFVAAFGEEIGANADFIVGGLGGRAGSGARP